MLAAVAIAALACRASPVTAQTTTVNSLGAVESHLKTPQAKQDWRQQMDGRPAPDRLGVHLPSGLSASAIAALLLPPGDHGKPTLVGARPWPEQPGRFVAIVCTGGEPFDPLDPVCQRPSAGESAPPLHVYLGILAMRPGEAPRLVARSGPIAGDIDWSMSDLPAPDDADDGLPDRIEGFDLAAYRIAPGKPAFGLRAGWIVGYSGGSARTTALYLFAPDPSAPKGERLRPVLAVPMSSFKDIAGDWHPDGTRDHTVTDEANILVVTPHLTAGHYDLLVKAKDWNPAKRPWISIFGIGATIVQKDGQTRVISTVAGDPAAAAGLAAGDTIAGIGGAGIHGADLATIRHLMGGRVGSPVQLAIDRAGHPPFTVTAQRRMITLEPSAHLRFRWSAKDAAYRAAACGQPCL